jgi:hypothetical protein
MVCSGEFQGKHYKYERKITEPVEMISTLKIPIGLKKATLELCGGEKEQCFPLRYCFSDKESWLNNWYVTLGNLDTTSVLSVNVEPYEPGLLKVACFEPDGKPLRWNNINFKYKNIEIGNHNIAPVYRPILADDEFLFTLADEEFLLTANCVTETEEYEPVTETLTLKSVK